VESVPPDSSSAGLDGLQDELAGLRRKLDKVKSLIDNPRSGGQAADGGVKAIVGAGGLIEALRISDEAYKKLGPAEMAQSIVVAIGRAQQANLEKYRAAVAEMGGSGVAAGLGEVFQASEDRVVQKADEKNAVHYKTLGR
jgi:DNA-binding protein YbaB